VVVELSAIAEESLGFSGDETSAEHVDIMTARLLELAECLGVTNEPLRAELERRNGSEFFARVAAMGTPAAEALSSHKIQYGQLFGRALARARQWAHATWCGLGGGWRRRYTHGGRRRSSSGRACGRTSSSVRAKGQRSSSGGTGRRSTRPSSSGQASRNTRSDEPAARSNGRRTHLHPLSPACAWSTVGRRNVELERPVLGGCA